MDVVDIDGDGDEQKPVDLAVPVASYPPPPMPSGPRKASLKLNTSTSTAGTSTAASSELGGRHLHRTLSDGSVPTAELGEDLSRRLEKIDGKLDWLVSRIKATSLAATRRDSGAGNGRGGAACVPMSARGFGSLVSVTDTDQKTTTLRNLADGGNVINISPPLTVNAPLPGGAGPNILRRGSTPVESVDRAAASNSDEASSSPGSPTVAQCPPRSPRTSGNVLPTSQILLPDFIGSRRPSVASHQSFQSRGHGSSTSHQRPSLRLHGEAGSMIPNLSIRPAMSRSNSAGSKSLFQGSQPGVGRWARSDKKHPSNRSAQVPAMFKDSLLARRIFERSQSKNIEHVQKRIQSLPMALRNSRSKRIDKIYTVLDDPASSKVAWWTAKALQAVVLLSVLVTYLQIVEDPVLHGWSAAVIESVFDFVFLAEVCVRFSCAPNRVNFFFSTHTWIDIAAASAVVVRVAAGLVLPVSLDDMCTILLLGIVPIVRLLKIVRHFETFNVLIRAVQITMEALPMLLYAVALITMTFAALIYVVEPELFESPFRAVWFCLVTVTTVGYGDYSPVTPVGITIVMCLIIVGVILLAVPMGIIGMTFNDVWNARDYSLLLTKTRMKLHQWGYTAHDIPTLFKIVDSDGNGVLELDEFCELVKEMKIGLSDNRIIALFEHMDKDGSGALDAAEFALEVFPETFVDAYGHEDNSIVNKPKASTSWMASLAATINRGTNFQRPTND